MSVGSSGGQGNNRSNDPSISPDGRYVAFESDAFNLVADDFNWLSDIFVCDLQGGTLERVSVNSSGVEGNSLSDRPSISADGRYVAFQSDASDLVSGDPSSGHGDVFVRDRQLRTTERVSVASSGAEGNENSQNPSVTPDGRHIAFESFANNLVAGDSNGSYDIFVHERSIKEDPTDTAPPTTTATRSAEPNIAGWNTNDVTVTLSSTDGDTGVKEITYSLTDDDTNEEVIPETTVPGASTSVQIKADGPLTLHYKATDNAGIVEDEQTLQVKIDRVPPRVNCVGLDEQWHAQDVTADCTTFDNEGGSGVANRDDEEFSLSTSVTDGTEDANAQTDSREVLDVAGNSRTVGPFDAKVDKTAPSLLANVSPTVNQTKVPLNFPVLATFDDDMDTDSVKTSFKLDKIKVQGSKVTVLKTLTATVNYAQDNSQPKTAELAPDSGQVEKVSTYRATIAKDKAGNTLQSARVWTFQTGTK